MDPQFEALAEKISSDVTERVSQAINAHVTDVVTAAERRLAAEFSAAEGRLGKEFSAAEGRLAAEFSAAETRLAAEFSAAENRLAGQARLNVEGVKEEATLAAGAYGGVLQSIDERLGRLEASLTREFGHYDAVLKNHNERITALEQKGT